MLDAFDDVTQEFTELRIDWLKVMKKSPFYLFFLLLSFVTKIACATSFGFVSTASISSVDALPAICLPNDAEAPFLVGLITVSESYVRNPGSWGVALKDGATPLALKPGECIKFEAVQEGYEVDRYTTKMPRLQPEVNKTYIFRIHDAYKTRNSYSVLFCVSRKAQGALEYLEYTRFSNGDRLIPSCDFRRQRRE
ncbi:hypothetical protein [Pseudomonas mandelii]|uniref:hypothetical protein n=1 Tax=Pseudomonas mandelii TaxID=75612 RepID=UPI00224B826B|nr:hypothetical protein [Pseudomonas mandelii]MCX2897803.1 hypothetical protein [Pseudomonas mandelii]